MTRRCRVWWTSMMALHSRLTTTMFVLACALCAPGLIRARAQEVTPALENGGKCPTAGAPFVDPLSAPVRFIDAFVDGLDLAAAGFGRVEPKVTRPPGICARGSAEALRL